MSIPAFDGEVGYIYTPLITLMPIFLLLIILETSKTTEVKLFWAWSETNVEEQFL